MEYQVKQKEEIRSMFSEWIRRKGFWTIDFLTGSRVKRHYNDIHDIMENHESIKVQERVNGYLRHILNYAVKNVPFYKGIDPSDIHHFPVVNKNIIREKYSSFQSLELKDQRVFALHTSGSTGTPFVVRQDPDKRHRVYAEMIYFWEKAGYQLGMRYVFFRVWTDINRKSKVTAWARNLVMHDIVRLDKSNLESVRQMLQRDQRIRMLLSYASTFENLANNLYELGDTPDLYSISSVISSSEVLQETTRKKLKAVFGCDVVSMYSNQENGVLAQECIENLEFHLNTASYFFEFLKLDCDEPANIGEPARIVVTDLFNRAMPLIRYDTGDIAIVKHSCDCGWNTAAIESVHGRALDCIYDTRGRLISPVTITNYMWPFDKLRQFQFIQDGKTSYVLKLNGARGVYEDSEFIRLFRGLLGEDAVITVEHVDGIPVLDSGKRKHVVCKFVDLI